VQADNKRVQNLVTLAYQVNSKWNSSKHALPSNAQWMSVYSLQDPVSHQPYEYNAKSTNEYELCATFDRDNRKDTPTAQNTFWNRPQGHFCFALDPSQAHAEAAY
jgi:thiamine monophosphate kinase